MQAQKPSIYSVVHNASSMESGMAASVVTPSDNRVSHGVQVKALQIKMTDIGGHKYSINIEPVGETIHDYKEKVMDALQDVSLLINVLKIQNALKTIEEQGVGIKNNFRSYTTGFVKEGEREFSTLVLKVETSQNAGMIVQQWYSRNVQGVEREPAVGSMVEVEFVTSTARDAAILFQPDVAIMRNGQPVPNAPGFDARTAEYIRAVVNTGAATVLNNHPLRGMLRSEVFDDSEKQYISSFVLERSHIYMFSKIKFAYQYANEGAFSMSPVLKSLLESDVSPSDKVQLIQAMLKGLSERSAIPYGLIQDWLSLVLASDKLDAKAKVEAVTGI